MSTKILLASKSALLAKYQKPGFNKVMEAVKLLRVADSKRGFTTSLIFVDDEATMRRYRGRAVTDPKSGQQHKEAIDAIYAALEPEYLVILDAPDIIPHISMQNPAREDGDPDVPSDLPYACNTPYDRDPSRNLSVTRVVGRIPGIMGDPHPTHLTNAIKASAAFKPRPRRDYLACFALSAEVWQKSTAKNLKVIFGKDGGNKVRTSPPIVKSGANRFLSPLTHFINCHGAPLNPDFFGQRGDSTDYTALMTEGVAANGKRNTIIAAECCYGANLYDPTLQKSGRQPIANSYFDRGAIAFFGSTTIAYGDAARLSAADYLTQYFLLNVLAGASLGRACLEARQLFVNDKDFDNYCKKTIAQFILLGDPSLHPCLEDDAAERQIKDIADPQTARRIRRMELAALGKSAGEAAAYGGAKNRKPSGTIAKRAKAIARKLGVRPHNIESYDVSGGPLYRGAMRSQEFRPKMIVVTQQSRPVTTEVGDKKLIRRRVKAVVVHTHSGGVARVAHYISR
jgi:peptidase C25-like protein